MKSLVIYFSRFGNTKQVAEAMQSALAGYGSSQAVSIDQVSPENTKDLDLVIMGCPTHVATTPKEMRPMLAALPKRCFKGAFAAVFDTSNEMPRWLEPFTAAKPLRGKVRSRGGRMAARPETFRVIGREGPMGEGEIERAQEWASAIAEKVEKKRN